MFSKQDIFSKEWCDIVFKGRNKKYGAYELRRDANKRLGRALLVVAGSAILLGAIPAIVVNVMNEERETNVEVNMLSKIKIEDEPIPDLPKEPLTFDDLPNNPIKAEKKNELAGSITIVQDGTATELGNGKATEAAKDSIDADASLFIKQQEAATEDEEVIENTPDDMAQFEGKDAVSAFRSYIARNLKYPEQAMDSKIQGTVYVQFVVEKDGSLSHITILRGVVPLIDQEVVKVVKASPAWTPAKKKGVAVRVSYTIPIVFQIN